MRERLRNEDGIALVMALGITVVLIIFVASMISYTTSGQRSATLGSADLQARQYAEGGLNSAYSLIVNANSVSGGSPTAANLIGCNGVSGPADTTAPSNCASPSPKVICLTKTTCTVGTAGSASVFGFFSGANPATYNGTTVPASTWLLVSTGFARNPSGNAVTAKTTTSTIQITALNGGAVAAVWNHIFLTAPLVPNVCQTNYAGNNTLITSPMYVVGNLCLTGNNISIAEAVGGQPIDLMVGGKLMLGSNRVGADSTHPITGGVVVGGCTTVSVASATSSCTPASFNYWVGTTDTFVSAQAPEQLGSDIAADYANFDPGPKHSCAAGGLPATTFDNDTTQNGTNASFELLPASNYTCISQSGASVGQLTWNNATKQLTVNGSVFLDGNLTISQSGTYTGTGVIEAAGTITFNGNGTSLCATSPCNFTNWQGSSGNNSMLLLVSLKSSTTSVVFTNNNETFQGSIWTQPSSTMTFAEERRHARGPGQHRQLRRDVQQRVLQTAAGGQEHADRRSASAEHRHHGRPTGTHEVASRRR